MRKFTLEKSNIEELIDIINHDVISFQNNNVSFQNIIVSIPEYVKIFFEDFFSTLNNDTFEENIDLVFHGAKYTQGYNDQIYVFNKNAKPDDSFKAQPIQIIIKTTDNE